MDYCSSTKLLTPSHWYFHSMPKGHFTHLEITTLPYSSLNSDPGFHLSPGKQALSTPRTWQCSDPWYHRPRGWTLCPKLSQAPVLQAHGYKSWGWSIIIWIAVQMAFYFWDHYFFFFFFWRIKNVLGQWASYLKEKQNHSLEWEHKVGNTRVSTVSLLIKTNKWRKKGSSTIYGGSVQFSRSVVSDFSWPHEPQHARPPCLSPTPGVHPNPCPLSGWCHPTISSSVVPFSSCPQSFPAPGSFPVSQLFASSG